MKKTLGTFERDYQETKKLSLITSSSPTKSMKTFSRILLLTTLIAGGGHFWGKGCHYGKVNGIARLL